MEIFSHVQRIKVKYLSLLLSSFLILSQISCADSETQPFCIIVFPDTQIYSKDDPSWRKSSEKEVFMAMTQWVKEHVKPDNIKFVLHMGDIVNEDYEPRQWNNANEAMSILDDFVPYAFAVGNHDLAPGNPINTLDSSRNTTNYNHTFPYTRYQDKSWFGGRMMKDRFTPKKSYDNSYHFFEQGKLEFMIVSLEVGPTDEMLEWADSIINNYPTKRVIVMTHSYMLGTDKRDYPGGFGYLPTGNANTGEEIWNKLIKKHKNVFLVLSGHVENVDTNRGMLVSTGVKGNTIYQQLNGEAYDGWIRILRFVPAENKIYVQSYSPWNPRYPDKQLRQYDFSLLGYYRDSTHQYELNYNME